MDSYPASLPSPAALQYVRRERRAVSEIPGLTAARARSRELIRDARAEWVYSPEQMAIWKAWFDDTLKLGLCTFSVALPVRGGWQTLAVRYRTETVRLEHQAHGIYRVQASLEVSARIVDDSSSSV